MTYTINLDREQLNAILATMQNETIILTHKIKDMVRDKDSSYSQIEELTTRRNKLMEIIKVLEGKNNEFK